MYFKSSWALSRSHFRELQKHCSIFQTQFEPLTRVITIFLLQHIFSVSSSELMRVVLVELNQRDLGCWLCVKLNLNCSHSNQYWIYNHDQNNCRIIEFISRIDIDVHNIGKAYVNCACIYMHACMHMISIVTYTLNYCKLKVYMLQTNTLISISCAWPRSCVSSVAMVRACAIAIAG
jgi:hypothetical protein